MSEILVGEILGGIIGVYLLTLLFNFVFKKIRKIDTKMQRIVSVFIATILAISTYCGLSIRGANEDIFYSIVAYIISGIVIAIKMLRTK